MLLSLFLLLSAPNFIHKFEAFEKIKNFEVSTTSMPFDWASIALRRPAKAASVLHCLQLAMRKNDYNSNLLP